MSQDNALPAVFGRLHPKFKDMKRPYIAPGGIFGSVLTVVLYVFMLFFADRKALLMAGALTLACTAYWFFFSRKKWSLRRIWTIRQP